MAKINHNNIMDTIDVSIENAKENNVLHHYAQNEFLKGGHLKIDDNDLWHFANTGYLGLEQDYRLKTAAAKAIFNYGTQFPLSKTYVSHPLYNELELLLHQIYRKQPLVVAKNSTLAHIGTIPHIVDYGDLVILDHQVHWSVQNACAVLKNKGIPVLMIRHNNMEQLEEFILKYTNQYKKIWYMADGIYSMYGDTLPVADIDRFLKKYKNFHLYVDDVHGMSWLGTHGSGFISSHWPKLDQRMVLITTLSKTFGASGAVILSGDATVIGKIKNFGGPLTFSAQLEPASVAAAIASAKIHLSPEIYNLQNALWSRIRVFQDLLVEAKIPLMSTGETPVFYVATGMPETAYYLIKKLALDGFYVNPGLFPAVPANNAGLRITVCNHNHLGEIVGLAKSLKKHFPKALIATGNSYEKLGRSFKRKFSDVMELKIPQKSIFNSQSFTSILEINPDEWNRYLIDQAFDYDGFAFIEKYFSSLDKEDPNYMEFKYHLVRNHLNEVEALTQTSVSLWKEDMLAQESVSNKIEEIRKSDPRFLTEKVLSTGSVFSEGLHFYLNKNAKSNTHLERTFFDLLEVDFEQHNYGKLVLRDLNKKSYLYDTLYDRGYVMVEMPDTAIFSNFDWVEVSEFENILSKRSRRHFREEVLPFIDHYQIETVDVLSEEDLKRAYELYLNVKENNIAINNFSYNYDLFQEMNNSELWKFLLLKEKDSNTIDGIMFCYINKANNSFNPILVGMTSDEGGRLNRYRQLLFHTILYAKANNYSKIYFGLSAIFEKRKLGAKVFYKSAFVRMKDNYNSDLLQSFE